MDAHYAVIYTEKRKEAKEAAEYVKKLLSERGASVEIYSATELIGKKLPDAIDYLIALGGDGTILKSVQALSDSETPILGINFGHGGFLMEVDSNLLEEAIRRLLDGKYHLEKVMMISATVGDEKISDALNEIYIASRSLGKTLEFSIYKKTELAKITADGLIISTPIGSTAYAYSAGGPIVDDELEAVVLVPVCPLTHSRPLVLSLKEKIKIDIFSEYGVQILIDGFVKRNFEERSMQITVEKSENAVNFVRLGLGESFVRRVKKKLG